MFVPREKNINVIEESFVLLKPDVAESHGILIDTFTAAGFSVSAKKIPRSKEIIDAIVKYFPSREVGSHLQRTGGRFGRSTTASRLYPKDSFTMTEGKRSPGGGGGKSPLNREDSLFSRKSGGNDGEEGNEGGEEEDEAARFARMRQHRSAITRGTLDDSPMAQFVSGTPGGRKKRDSDGRVISSWQTHSMAQSPGGSSVNNNNNNNKTPGETSNKELDLEDEEALFPFRSIAASGSAGNSPSSYSARHSYLWGHNENDEDAPPTFGDQLKFILQGTCMALVVSAANAVEAVKVVCGPESPKEAKEHYPNSIRAQFGTSRLKNAVFCAPSHDVASELIELVFGYQTEQRTEVVRFSNQTQQQQQNKDLYSHVDELTLQELEEANGDVVSAALDAAIFGADVAPPPNPNQISTNKDKDQNNNNSGQQQQIIDPATGKNRIAASGTGGVIREGSDLMLGTDEGVSPKQQALSSSMNNQKQQQQQQQQTSNNNDYSGPNTAFAMELQRQSNILRAREIDLMLREKTLAESSWMFRGDGVKIADPPKTGKELFGSPKVGGNNTTLALKNKDDDDQEGNNNNNPNSPGNSKKTNSNSNQDSNTQNNNNNTPNYHPGNRRLGQHASWTTINHPNSRAETHVIKFIEEEDVDDYMQKYPSARLLSGTDDLTDATASHNNTSSHRPSVSGGSGMLSSSGSGNNNSRRSNAGNNNFNNNHVILPLVSRSHRGMPQPNARVRKMSMHGNSGAFNNSTEFDNNNNSSSMNENENNNNNNENGNTLASSLPGASMGDEKYDKDLKQIRQHAASGSLSSYQIQQQQRLRGYHGSSFASLTHQGSSASMTNNTGSAQNSPSGGGGLLDGNNNNNNSAGNNNNNASSFGNSPFSNASSMMMIPTPPRSNHLGRPSSHTNLNLSTPQNNNHNNSLQHQSRRSVSTLLATTNSQHHHHSNSQQQQHHHHQNNPFIENHSHSSAFGFHSKTAPKPPPPMSSVLDPSLVFECGSDNLKLKNLFERFEYLAKNRREAVAEYENYHRQQRLMNASSSDTPGSKANNNKGKKKNTTGEDQDNNDQDNNNDASAQQQQQQTQPGSSIHPRYGRLVPKAEFVEYVRAAVQHDCIDTGNPEALVRPIMSYIDSVCGRGGAEWVTFDEFIMVLMKIMQT